MTASLFVTLDIRELGISERALELYVAGFTREALLHDAQDLLMELRDRVDVPDMSDNTLVEAALQDKSPLLTINGRKTAVERNQHAAFRHMFLAVTRGVRNVFAHDVRREVSEREAVRWLMVMGHLRSELEDADPAIDQFAASGQS